MRFGDAVASDGLEFTCESGPLFISLDVTGACNFRCLHCYNSSGSKLDGEFTDKEILEIANQIAEFKPLTVCMCGGEPMLRKNIIEIISCISTNAGAVNMVTNGSLINEINIRKLKDAGLTTLQVSLDGINSMQNDTFRGFKGAFDKAVNAIKLAKSVGLNVYTSFVPNKLNHVTIPEYIKMCYELGVSSARFMPLIPMGRGSKMDKLLLSSEEYLNLQLTLKGEMEKYKFMPFTVEWGDPLDHYVRMPNNACSGFNSLQMEIKANGNLTVSTYIPIVAGNVKKHTLREYWDAGYKKIWSNSQVLNYIKNIQTIYDINQLDPRPFSGDILYIELIKD